MTAPATKQNTPPAVTSPIERLKATINLPSVQEQFRNALADNAPLFVASLIDLYGSDSYIQKCEPKAVIMEALKAATLKLPINKQLGFAYIVPYNKSRKVGNEWVKEVIPTFQIGYRGYIQLAMRTGAYKHINADVIYEGELKASDKLTGEIDLSGTKKSDTVVGYFAHIETINGFRKTIYGTKEQVESHAKRYSKSYDSDKSSPWKTNFDEMAVKTMLRQLLGKFGIMSVEMIHAFTSDKDFDERTPEAQFEDDVRNSANTGPVIDMETGEVKEEAQPESKTQASGPRF